jgi:heptosyltransferase I
LASVPEGPALLADSRRLVIIMLSAIGDAVHVLPVIHALKQSRPDLHITWVIQPVPHELVAGHPAVDDFVLFRRVRGRALWGELDRCARELRGHAFDLALGLQVYLKAGLLLWRSGARAKLGFDRARARDLQWLFSSHRIPRRPAAHVQDQYFEFLDYLGVKHGDPRWGLSLSQAEQSERRVFFERFKRPVCGIIVGTSNPEKNWLPERCARLIEALESDLGMDTLLLGGPSESERELAARIQACARLPLRCELGPGVRRLLWLLSGCDLVISPDTGPLHMARAIDVPVVGLYGYTNPKRTGPYRKYVDLVVDGFAVAPDEDYGVSAPYRSEGMSRVRVEAVLAKVELARRLYPRRAGRAPA